MSTTETYPHRRDNAANPYADCRCGARSFNVYLTDGATWGSNCPAALREALETAKMGCDTERGLADDLRWQRDAAHDQLADIAALVAGELAPDDRSGGDPVLGRAWDAVKSQLGALVCECREHTRCMGERDAALARIAELERATPGPHIPPALMRRVEALGFTPGSGEPVGWLVAQVEELVATLANERGEGEPPSEGWAWIDGAWRRTDDNGGFAWSVHNFDPGRWQWRQHDPPYARSRRPMSTARAAIIAAMQAADKARTP